MASRLKLAGMDERHRGLTPAVAGAYREAAAVCLSRHRVSPVLITLSDNGIESPAEVEWEAPDDRTQGAWANSTDATEAGAYGCVLAGVEELRGLVAVRRAETGTGADYYIGPPGSGVSDLEDCIRLEVSGVDAGDQVDVRRRLVQKVGQVREGKGSLPALAGVIGFSARLLLVRDVMDAP
jgi:hypothetical protein